MKSFKVSIILPVYNVEKYLSACLDSLLAQTLEEIEIVAVNDGSTDGSLQILQAYQSLNPEKLFIFSTENHGVSRARNYGFAHSHGEYVWFVDSDDFVEPDACRLLYEKATADGNDLVLFRYYNVDSETGVRKEYIASCHNQNFRVADKPYELPAISPYPWIKFIHRDLFNGLCFPEGIRFEDLPVAYLLAVKARSIGYVDQCFYNYRKNVGFLSRLTPSTLHIRNAIIFMKEEMEKLGLFEQYQTELDFIAVRHFFYRFWKLLTNYETNQKELKLQLVNELFDYMESNIPDWENNHYVRYSLPPHIGRLLCLYGSRQEMISFIEACNGMTVQQQKAWIKDYKLSHKTSPSYQPAEMIHREKTSSQFYGFAYTGSLAPDPEQILLEASRGKEIPTWILKLLVHLLRNFGEHQIIVSLTQEKHALFQALLNRYLSDSTALSENITLVCPDSEEYGKALALSGYVITDGPLPYYFRKEEGQFVLLYCGHNLYPETVLNTPDSTADTGLWQHTMFMADCLYFNNVQNRDIYLQECMTANICKTPYIIGSSTHIPVIPNESHREKLRRSLQMDSMQTILYAPLLPGSYIADTEQTFRNFMAALYIFDCELSDHQVLYLHLDHEREIDFSEFRHIKEMPKDFDVPDFAAACDIFVSDYHNALSAKFSTETQIIRFLCGTFWNQEDEFFPEYPAFDNVPELVRYIRQLDLGSGETPASEESPQYLLSDIVDSLLNGRPLPYYTPAVSDDTPPRTRVLFFTGRKLSQNLVRDFNALAAQAPEKEFWLAYNDFRNTDSAKYLAQLSPDCSSLPLKPDPEKGNRWKLASVLTSRMGLFSFYPLSHILDLGKEEYKKCMGGTRFDEVVITSTDSIKTVATLLAAAPKASYTFDTFNPERYSTSRPYRHQIAFLCRMLKDTGSLELPAELTGLKLTQSSGKNKDKGML
ncbi:glycosyltransferase family 2 protein [Blautia faecis]|uniref:bifunctional glycosyltransferase/CDP-glycerol:glycerophosphate glycerophosphotransferase n=1 Tax=Blautia TaxID=572511 RepID=UPI00156E434A|nr:MULTISPECIES: glycosyltransferase family 2 protein [Blautia]MCB5522474.1 glycosyltransferase [Blautia schinkii]NSD60318.1 glycosyltransferase family 2 protein [Blautia faecis]